MGRVSSGQMNVRIEFVRDLEWSRKPHKIYPQSLRLQPHGVAVEVDRKDPGQRQEWDLQQHCARQKPFKVVLQRSLFLEQAFTLFSSIRAGIFKFCVGQLPFSFGRFRFLHCFELTILQNSQVAF